MRRALPAVPRGPRRRRLLAVVTALAALLVPAACNADSTATATPVITPAASGQSTHGGLLPNSARTFPAAGSGWSAGSGATVVFTSAAGHRHLGALRVSYTAPLAAVASPTFPVTAGHRYSAAAWVRAPKHAADAATVSMSLQFLDASGKPMHPANQIGQRMKPTKHWQRLLPVVGFAPTGATRARVGLVHTARRSGQAILDDVSVTTTTGTAAPLHGPLRVEGRNIVDSRGHRVVLRGIEIDGLQTNPQLPLKTMLVEVKAARGWGANLIRIPLNPDHLLKGGCSYDSSYLTKVSQLTRAVTATGMLAELDLHVFSLRGCTPALITLPDYRGIQFWRKIAPHFASNNLVAYDLYNEPNNVTSRIWRDGGTVSWRNVTYSGVGMRQLYDTVRQYANNLVFISGSNYATALPTTAPLAGTTNAVYAVHVYTCPTGLPSQGQRCPQKGPGGITDPTLILHRFDSLAKVAPVVVDEFGFPGGKDGRMDANVIRYVAHHDWSGWSAFTFDGTNSGLFNLVKNVGATQQPDVNGMSVMTGLVKN